MKSIKTTLLLAIFVLTTGFCFAQNQNKPVVPPKEETTKPKPAPTPTPTPKPAVINRESLRRQEEEQKRNQCSQWFRDGKSAYFAEIYDNALYYFNMALQQDCENSYELREWSQKCNDRKKEKQAKQDCEQWLNDGKNAYNAGNYDNALYYFNTALQQNCSNSYELNEWKQKCNDRKKEKQAKQDCDQWFSDGKNAYYAGNYENALYYFNYALQKNCGSSYNLNTWKQYCNDRIEEKRQQEIEAQRKREEEAERRQALSRGYYKLGSLWVSTRNFGAKEWKDAKRMEGNTTIGGFSTWRLPTYSELKLIYANRFKIWGDNHPWNNYKYVWYDGPKCNWGSSDGGTVITSSGKDDCFWRHSDKYVTVILVL